MPRQSTKQNPVANANQLPTRPLAMSDDTLLTTQQDAYARLYVEHGARAYHALIEAGYRPKNQASAAQMHVDLASKPHVLRAIRKYQKAMLSGELATLSLKVVKEILEDKTANPRVRLEAAKVAMDRGGIGDLNLDDLNSLNGLSLDTLKDLLSQTKTALGDIRELENDPRLLEGVIEGKAESI